MKQPCEIVTTRYRDNRNPFPGRITSIVKRPYKDWKTPVAAEVTGCNRKTVHRAKTFFKTHFAKCFQAWKRDFGF